ncbi:MAG: protein BatD [Bergeyella sp.]|nr:protein BatD [Bergeyella sp.]
MKRKHRILIFFLVFFISISSRGQMLTSQLNKKTATVGEPLVYTIKIENLQGKDVMASPKNELLPFHFQVFRDSIIKKKESYVREITFSIDEEGRFVIPELQIKIGDSVKSTISYEIEVSNPTQEGEEPYDIMNNKKIKLSLAEYWELYKWYVLFLFIVVALIITLFMLVRYARHRGSPPLIIKNQTLKKLHQLKKKKYIEKLESRAFYIELVEIIRDFLSDQYGVSAKVLLTEDLLLQLKGNSRILPENERVVGEVFRRADGVKFAKMRPDVFIMRRDLEATISWVKRSLEEVDFEKLRKDV